MTMTSPNKVIVASVVCSKCGDKLKAKEDVQKFQYCSCGKSWIKGFHSLQGHNTSILCDRSGQLFWEF